MNAVTDHTRVKPTTTNVLCAITSAVSSGVFMTMTGVAFVTEHNMFMPIFMAIGGVGMMLIALHSAWIAGRVSESKEVRHELPRNGRDWDRHGGGDPDEPVPA